MTETIIRVTSRGHSIPYGTELPATIDGAGDAELSYTDSVHYDTRWVFKENFEIVEEPTEPKDPGDLYTLTVPIKDLTELYDLFQYLPRSVVEKVSLRIN